MFDRFESVLKGDSQGDPEESTAAHAFSLSHPAAPKMTTRKAAAANASEALFRRGKLRACAFIETSHPYLRFVLRRSGQAGAPNLRRTSETY